MVKNKFKYNFAVHPYPNFQIDIQQMKLAVIHKKVSKLSSNQQIRKQGD